MSFYLNWDMEPTFCDQNLLFLKDCWGLVYTLNHIVFNELFHRFILGSICLVKLNYLYESQL